MHMFFNLLFVSVPHLKPRSQFRRISLQIQLKLDILQEFLVQYQQKKSANILNVQYVYLCLDQELPFLHVLRVTWFALCADLKLGYVQSVELQLQKKISKGFILLNDFWKTKYLLNANLVNLVVKSN